MNHPDRPTPKNPQVRTAATSRRDNHARERPLSVPLPGPTPVPGPWYWGTPVRPGAEQLDTESGDLRPPDSPPDPPARPRWVTVATVAAVLALVPLAIWLEYLALTLWVLGGWHGR